MSGKEKLDIHLVTTGGTIEKTYDEYDGSLSNRHSVVKQIVSELRLPYAEIHHHSLMAKDSLDMSDEDRQTLVQFVKSLLPISGAIVVLHGTDTMAVSAEACQASLGVLSIPVIFTGAMRPLGFDQSDARQNVTEALFGAQCAPAGVYIAFHGKLHPVPGVRKNRDLGTFESVTP